MRKAKVSGTVAFLVGAAALLASNDARATREIGLGAAYDMRAPVGGFRSFVPNTSFSGFQVKWDFYPLDALSTGVEVQYHLFQRDLVTDSVAFQDGVTTATTFRYASFWSFVPTVRYHFFEHGALRPYLSLGAGAASVTSAILVSDVSRRDNGAAFVLQPSVGVLWRLSPERWTPSPDAGAEGAAPGMRPRRKPMESMFGLTASLTYTFTTADVASASDVSYAGLQLGIYAKP